MKSTQQEFCYADCILSMDACHWGSPSYRGMSSRTELWMTSLALLLLQLVPGLYVLEYSPVMKELLDALLGFLLFFPLLIRRARQMGCTAYGVVVVAVLCMPLVLNAYALWSFGDFRIVEFFDGLFFLLDFLVLFPLYVLPGTFSGDKNALHRAAIAGDAERAARLLAWWPSGLSRRSQKGLTPREYAREAGHEELAAWFAQQENCRTAAEKPDKNGG